jgi:hypothetical protein
MVHVAALNRAVNGERELAKLRGRHGFFGFARICAMSAP